MKIGKFACVLNCALLVFAAPISYAATPNKPLLWEVSDGDNSLYLLGSFHMLTADDYPLPATVDAAFADAEALLFELSPEEMTDPALGQSMFAAAQRRDGSRLQDAVPAATWLQLEQYAQANKLSVQQWQGLQPWFVSLLISVGEMQKIGLNPALGLDRHLQQRAEKSGKPAGGLETGAVQVALFADMTGAEQQQALQETLDKLGVIDSETRALHALWRAGDEQKLFTRMAAELLEKYPALYRRIQRDRNQAWLPALKSRLDSEKTKDFLVVVGAMHLLGPDGLLAYLRSAGYRIKRL